MDMIQLLAEFIGQVEPVLLFFSGVLVGVITTNFFIIWHDTFNN